MKNFWRRGQSVLNHLEDVERLVTLYLVEGPQVNRIGLYHLSLSVMADDLRWQPAVVHAAVPKVCGKWKFRFDADASVVWIPQWWVWSEITAESQFRAALRDVRTVPETPLRALWGESATGLPLEWVPYLKAAAAGRRAKLGLAVESAEIDLLGERRDSVLAISEVEGRIMDLWNAAAKAPILPVKRLGQSVRRHLKARLAEHPNLDTWAAVFRVVNETDYCTGRSEKIPGFVADLAYVVKKDETFDRFVNQAARGPVGPRLVPFVVRNCPHTPGCTSEVECSDRRIEDMA